MESSFLCMDQCSEYRVQSSGHHRREERDEILCIYLSVFKRYVNEMYNVKLYSTQKKKRKCMETAACVWIMII